jgi:hypothetical protein
VVLVHRHDVPAELLAVLELVEIPVVELVALLRIEILVGQVDPEVPFLRPSFRSRSAYGMR